MAAATQLYGHHCSHCHGFNMVNPGTVAYDWLGSFPITEKEKTAAPRATAPDQIGCLRGSPRARENRGRVWLTRSLRAPTHLPRKRAESHPFANELDPEKRHLAARLLSW